MIQFLDTIKGRFVVTLVAFVTFAHLVGLWLYVKRSEAAIEFLHDALAAERIALIARMMELTPAGDRERILKAISGRLAQTEPALSVASQSEAVTQTRAHLMNHLLGAFLGRPTHEGIVLTYSTGKETPGLDATLSGVNAIAHLDAHHRDETPQAEIKRTGVVHANVTLTDGSRLRLAAPLLTATSFSFFNLGGALAAMVGSAIIIATWTIRRWTQPLTLFAGAAERLGKDIHAPPLPEQGLYEVRTAAHAFNQMQERVRRLVEERTALAAAIAHDLGTPITRMRLRVEEMQEQSIKNQILTDLDQMRRMIVDTLAFARQSFDAERSEQFDLASLMQSICDEQTDIGRAVTLRGPEHLVVVSEPTSLRRAITNLIDNAVKYGDRATVTFGARGNDIEVRIEDAGPGIPDHFQDLVFRPFGRLPETKARRISGTGLGLTVARSIIERLGGTISLANSSKGGLRVSITLPQSH